MMIEQVDVPAGAMAASATLGRALSDEARASLQAVRVAQEAARLRVRQQTVRTRIWFGTMMGAAALAAVVFGVRMAARRHARAQAPTSARPSPVAPERVAQPIAPPATETVVAAAAAPSMPTPESADRSATEFPPVAAPAKSGDVATPDEGCDTGLLRKAPWRLSAHACARAFAADPSNAALALAIAHAEHAHGSVTEAAQWAKRALELDPSIAEAYLLIARAEVAKHRGEEARAAYRRYLELAPRGWHQAEARAAVARAPD
jgi:hypothetical protein